MVIESAKPLEPSEVRHKLALTSHPENSVCPRHLF